MADITDKIFNHLDKLTGLYGDLKQEFTMLNGAVSRIENEKLPAIETKIGKIETRLDKVETKLDRIEEKLDVHMRQPAHI
jgi:predicted  nucleic acid-binding Zn-ribbon protein